MILNKRLDLLTQKNFTEPNSVPVQTNLNRMLMIGICITYGTIENAKHLQDIQLFLELEIKVFIKILFAVGGLVKRFER